MPIYSLIVMWIKILKAFWPYILTAVLGTLLWNSEQRARMYKQESEILENTISDQFQQIKQTEIRLNDSILLYQAEVKTLNFTADNLKAKYNKLLKASQLKPKDVNTFTEIVSHVASTDTVIAEVDTFGGLKAQLKDEFVQIDVEVQPDRQTIIDYDIRDSLSVINVQKKHSILFGLIKWKSLESTRVINHNPKARIVGLETINVIQ